MKEYCRGDLNVDFIQRHLFISVPLNLHPARPVPKPDKGGNNLSLHCIRQREGGTNRCFHTKATHIQQM